MQSLPDDLLHAAGPVHRHPQQLLLASVDEVELVLGQVVVERYDVVQRLSEDVVVAAVRGHAPDVVAIAEHQPRLDVCTPQRQP